ncbi:kua-ubiquitin conjugating enzyme hybrid localization domain protein [Leptospira broomii serovar Hurstbridge str. 5399]|uniref:Kua-ubiquitin conjugating enzyme hybrid localization domain protein n=1 Tax=Leptospira broomii serovar Hurstbridge str. 5399 TaxID=1049789 RepID=T0F9N6_9LEPT|nr:kua-ubiquitin conjugating enzyme hybrid localization domain protein [Leptospira broomii serovar Hurstbridge str. 5399]
MDFISGFVHFLGDSFGNERTPYIGKVFIFPFREHHADPKGITRHDFVETNGNNCLVSLPKLIYD